MKTTLLENDDFENNENKINLNIEIDSFDNAATVFEVVEDLDEKSIMFLERLIRGSYEYKEYINYMKSELDLTKCVLMPNLDQKELKFTLEFHHFPFNLFEITQIVGTSLIDNLAEGKTISAFEICEKVMEEHYRNTIGLVPLSKTLHEMAHNRAIIIPIDKVNGNYKKFISKYSEYIDDDIKDRITDNELTSITEESKLLNSKKLEKKIVNYNINYLNKKEDEK